MQKATRPSPSSSALLLVLVTRRPAVQAFFSKLGARSPEVRVEERDFADEPRVVAAHAEVAVVDVAIDTPSARAFCAGLHDEQHELPIVGVVCCPKALDPWQLQSLFASGVSSVLDLQTSIDEAMRAIRGAARGSTVLHLHLQRAHRRLLHDLFVDAPARSTKLELLQLVARGLPDHEIGRRLHLSPHTVKHQIENLRGEVGARNRIELAAWAGRHGFYSVDGDDAVPVHLTQITGT
jgi:DNA-binding NarL/FixJ family response regulator